QASQRLSEAADIIGAHPPALQLRFLQTVVEISAEKASTVVFPLPLEMFEAVGRITEAFLPQAESAEEQAPPAAEPPPSLG
ncbi:MAG: slipin family protein, partial [Armatimonadetes bacterium]|nr:slipin family protein [Armatimonadota bacterium]